ncbi:MAG: SPOR domain-containing protein [Muribaculaceae bacterium]|nr:SPOR domain-containing protein [Muribaculaceae bacterium]
MKTLKLYILLMFVCAVSIAIAQEPLQVISDYLMEQTRGNVTVVQPEALRERLKHKKDTSEVVEGTHETSAVGYRIQVFSDNNQRTAKSNAQVRERNIATQFPELKVYLLYKSPTWRVRVGDFKTRGEAEQIMHEIKSAFPAYANEMTVVVDRINLPEK